MTVQSATSRADYDGNGVTVDFAVPFRFLDKTHLQVIRSVIATGVETVLTLDSGGADGYTVTGAGSASGGEVTVITPPVGAGATQERITILRNVPATQLLDFIANDAFPAESHERGLDQLTMLHGQQGEVLDRALVLPAGVTGVSTALPQPTALYTLRWNASANALENVALTPYGDAEGADLIGFQQAGAGMVLRTLQDKNRDVVHADDRGLLGDGTDETTALQDLIDAAAGKVLMLGAAKTYGVSAAGITFPPNTTLVANGSKFRKLAASTAYGITVGAGTVADSIEIDVTGGSGVADPGVQVAGDNVRIGRIKVAALTAGATPSDPYAGVYLGTGAQLSGIDVGYIETSGIQVPVIVDTLLSSTLGWVQFSDYKRGIYIKDCNSLRIGGGEATSMATGATGSAGQNAILIESAAANYSTSGIYISDFTARVSPEHGFRIGGQFIAANIHFNHCASYLAGSGSAPSGGCGIKVLGPTSVPSYHESIFVNGFLVEDAGNTTGENFHIADFGLVDGLSVKGLVGRKRTRSFSSYGGLRLSKLKNANIEANITETNIGAIRFIETAGFAGMVAMQNVRISGVFDTGNALSDAITMDCLDTTYRNVSINGAVISGGRSATRVEAPTGAGAYTSVSMTFDYLQQDTALAALTGGGNAAILYNVRAAWNGTPSAKDGSIYQDFTNGITREMRAGTWYESGERSGTWTPTFTAVTNVDAASASGVWRWSRVGDIVTFSGSANIDVTAASTLSEVGVSLPVASNLASSADAGGTGVAYTNATLCGTVQGDPTNDRIALKWFAGTATTSIVWYFTGSYRVI
jgi:hypothetical protein